MLSSEAIYTKFFFYAISWESYIEAAHVRSFFARDWEQKTSLTKTLSSEAIFTKFSAQSFLEKLV